MTREGEISHEAKDKIIKEAYSRAEALELEECDLEGFSSRLRQWLEKQEGVAEVAMAYDSDLTVRFVDGTQVGILLGRDRLYGSRRAQT